MSEFKIDIKREWANYQRRVLLNFNDLLTGIVECTKEQLRQTAIADKGENKAIVYIAGKVTGLKPAHVQAKFNQRKTELITAGYIVINPCDYISADTDWKLAMAICFVLLPHANYISLLHDWQDSKGAVMEKEFADKMGIEILSL